MPLDMRGRHAQARPQLPTTFRCVSCGAENQGPLEKGCQLCGSGAPGVHLEQVLVLPPTDPPPAADTTSVDDAYLRWKKQHPHAGEIDPELVYEAFKAGYMLGIAQVAETRVPLAGTAESRTVVAALRLFKENILPTAAEEIASGEFLDGPSIDRLIQRLERTGG